jgi:hypothetical protein
VKAAAPVALSQTSPQLRQVLVAHSEILDNLPVDQGVDRIEFEAIHEHAFSIVFKL